MSGIDDILQKLNPKTAKAFIKASEVKTEYLETPSVGINMAIGGIRYGGFTTIYGNRGSGKTLFVLQMIANAQKAGKTVAWVDVERNWSPEWATRLGVDPSEVILDETTISIAGMADKGRELILAGIDVLVVDSISQLLPQSYFEDPKDDDGEIKNLSQTGQIGTFSKNIGQAVNILNGVNQNTAIIFISQVRTNINAHGKKEPMGGFALEHANSTLIKLWRTPSEVLEDKVAVGDSLMVKRPVGYPANWTIEKNRGPGMNESNTYDVYTYGDFVGVDTAGELITYGVEYGVVNKGGAWYTVYDEKFQGKPAAAKYIRENQDVKDKLYGDILAKSVR